MCVNAIELELARMDALPVTQRILDREGAAAAATTGVHESDSNNSILGVMVYTSSNGVH